MTKNKKKLRRAERRYSVTKSAQTLVLAGMLLAGGVSGAMAAGSVILSNGGTGTIATTTNTTEVSDTAELVVIQDAGATITTGPINITATNGLQIGSNFDATNAANGKFTVGAGQVLDMGNKSLQIGGLGTTGSDAGKTGDLIINATGSMTNAGNITIGGHGGNAVSSTAGAAGGNGTLTFDNGATAVAWSYGGGILQVGGIAGTANGATAGGVGGTGSLVLGQHGLADNAGSNGTLTITDGGTLSVNNQGTVQVGGDGGASSSGNGFNGGDGILNLNAGSIANVSGGTINVGGAGSNNNSSGNGGNGGAGTLNVATGATLNFTGENASAVTLGGAAGTGGTGNTDGVGTVDIAGTMNVYGANTATITVNKAVAGNNVAISGVLNVGTAAEGTTTAQHGLLTVDGNGGGILVKDDGEINVISAGTASNLTAATTVEGGGVLNLMGSATKGSIHTGAVTLNGAGATLNALGGVAGDQNTLSAGLSFGANGGIVNVGDEEKAGFLTVTNAFTIENGGEVNVQNGSTFKSTAHTTLTDGSLNLSGGSTHTGNLSMNGGATDDAVLNVTGGTKTTPNTITGTLTSAANAGGTINVGLGGEAGALKVNDASSIGNATGTVLTNMDITSGSLAYFDKTLTINANGEVTTQKLTTGTGSSPAADAADGLAVKGTFTLDGGALNILNNFELSNANNAITFNSGSTLRVGGELSTAAAITTNQNVVSKTYKATADAANGIAAGSLTLLGTGTVGDNVLQSNGGAGFTVSASGALNLGTIDDKHLTALGLAPDYAQGGTINDKITVSGGSLNVATGDWHMNNAADGLTVGGGTVAINGNLTADTLKATSGTVTVNTSGKLTTQLGNFGKIDTNTTTVALNNGSANTSIKIAGNGALVLTGISNGTYTSESLSLTDAKVIRTAVMSGNGTLKLQDYTITTDAKTDKLSAASGFELADATLGLTTSETITANTIVKDMQVQPNVTGNITIITNANTLTLVGDKAGTNLINGLTGTQKVDINVASGGLALGLVDSASTGGILNANITGAGDISSTNGDFEVAGTVAAKQTTIDVTNKSLTFSKGNISTAASALDGGTLSATDTTSGNLTIDNLRTSANGGKVIAAKNLSIVTTAILDGDTIMEAGGNVVATGLDIATAKGDLSITAGNAGTITAGNISAGDGKAQLILNAGKTITAADIQGGDKSSINAASLTADALTLAGGEFNLLDDKATSTLGGALKLGSTDANKLSAVAGDVKGKLILNAGGDLLGGSSLAVNELTLAGTMNVGSDVEKSTGKLSVKVLNLASGNTLFVDPAWVDGKTTHETGYASQVAVENFGAADDASKITGNVIGGQASQITLGSTDLAWVQKKLDAYNATHGTNIWGNDDNLVSAALGIVSPFTVTGSGSVVVDGNANNTAGTNDGSATFGANSLLIVDANGVGAGKTALSATNINVAENAKLMLTNATVGTKYSVAEATGTLDIEDGSWDGANILTDHRLLTGVLDDTTDTKIATVTINQRSATSVLPGLSSEMGGLIDNMIKQNHTSENSPHAGVRFANRAINRLNGDQAAATIEGAAQLAVVGAAPAMTLSAVQAGTSTVTTRTSFASPLMDSSKAVALHKDTDGTLSVDSGLNAGNGMKNGFGLWIMPLYQSNSAWGMKADGFKGGYKSDLGGVALGADYTVNDMFRFGLAFNIGGGYAESNGDFNKTENSFSFWGINAYGGWAMNNFGITADVGYTGNYNKLQQELPGSMGMGDIKSDVNSSAWTAGLRGEYKFATEALDIIPHVGVRYTGLTTDEYKAKSGGETVFKVEEDFQSIWTFPIGVTLAKEIETGSGWIIRPQVDLGITPATGDVKAKSKVRIPGVDAQAEMKMQVVDYMSYDGGLGLEMKKDNVSFGINYNIQASEHRTGHGVFGTFRYEF